MDFLLHRDATHYALSTYLQLFLSELIQHHLLLPLDPRDVKVDERHQKSGTSDHIFVEEEELSNRPQKASGAHRAANPLTDAGANKPLSLRI